MSSFVKLFVFVLVFGSVYYQLDHYTEPPVYQVAVTEMERPVIPSTTAVKETKPKNLNPAFSLTREQERVAKSVKMLYKHVTLAEARQVVFFTYKFSKEHQIRPSLALGIIAHESGFRKTARSSEGAVGYTQVIPKYHLSKIRNRDIFDTRTNIQVGLQILGDCLKERTTLDGAIGCYSGNKNPDKVTKYITLVYLKKEAIFETANVVI